MTITHTEFKTSLQAATAKAIRWARAAIANIMIDTAQLVDGAVTNNKLAGSITADKLAGSIPYSKLSFSNDIVAGDIASGSISNTHIASNAAIAGSKIQAAGSSNSGVITSGTQTLGGTKTWAGRQYYSFRYHTFDLGFTYACAIGALTDGAVFLQAGGTNNTGNALEVYGTGGSGPVVRFRDVDSGSAAFRCDRVYSDTSSSGANVGITSSGNFYRSTSSARFKRNIEDAEKQYYRKVLDLRPVFYRAKGTCDADLDWSYWGFIAEEVAEIEPRLAQWSVPDDDEGSPGKGKTPEERKAMAIPDGVDYGRVAVLLQAVVRDHDEEITTLREEIKTLKNLLSGWDRGA